MQGHGRRAAAALGVLAAVVLVLSAGSATARASAARAGAAPASAAVATTEHASAAVATTEHASAAVATTEHASAAGATTEQASPPDVTRTGTPAAEGHGGALRPDGTLATTRHSPARAHYRNARLITFVVLAVVFVVALTASRRLRQRGRGRPPGS